MTLKKLNSKLILFLSLSLLFMFPIASAIVSHPASQVEPGAFQNGNYTFNGSVGIGTTTPRSLLTLREGKLTITNTNNALNSESPTAKLGLLSDNKSSYVDFELGIVDVNLADEDSMPTIRWRGGTASLVDLGQITTKYKGAGMGDLVFLARNGSNLNEVMRVANTGKVGIGTATPTRDLHIQSATPGIRFQDTDDNKNTTISMSGAGLYFDAADGGGFAFRNGSFNTNVIITSPGYVGIGTTSPTQTLHVEGNLNVTGTSYLGNIVLTADEITTNSVKSKDGNITFKDSSSNEVMRITSDGKVGIGTTTPAYYLDVDKNVSDDVVARVRNTNSTGKSMLTVAGDVSAIRFISYGTTHAFANLSMIYATGTSEMRIQNAANSPMTFYVNSAENMRITSGGKVGIGTVSPSQKLEINGTGGTGAIRITDYGNPGIGLNDSQRSEFGGMQMVSGNLNFYTLTSASDSANITYYFSGGLGEVMRIVRSSGNVGIGTTSPDASLTVRRDSGDAQIKVSSTGTSTLIAASANQPGVVNLSRWDSDILVDEELGAINFVGDSDVGTGASIVAAAAGGWNADSETNLIFKTTISGQTSPAERMRITSDGKVGIGTTTPGEKLEVVGKLKINDSTTPVIVLSDNSVNWTIEGNAPSSHVNGFSINGPSGTAVNIKAQNVGLGGAFDPSYTLHVRGSFMQQDSNGNNALYVFRSENSSRLHFYSTNNTYNISSSIYSYFNNGTNELESTSIMSFMDPSDYGGFIRIQTSPIGPTTGAWNAGVVINKYGFVGVNTENPASQLDIASTTGGDMVRLSGYAINQNNKDLYYLNISSVVRSSSVDYRFQTKDFAGGTKEIMYINSTNGYVGINTLSPKGKLHVNLTGQGDSFRVSSASPSGSHDLFTIGAGDSVAGAMSLSDTDVVKIYLDARSSVNSYINAGNVGIGTTTPDAALEVNGAVIIGYDSASCDSSKRGALRFVAGGSGVPDELQVCAKDSTNVYAWVDISNIG